MIPPLRRLAARWLQRPANARRVATDHAADGIPVRILAPAVWHYRDGLAYSEIAALLDITEDEVRRRVLLAHEFGQRLGSTPTLAPRPSK